MPPQEPPLAHYLAKRILPAQQEFADWLTAKTGYEADLRTVALCSALRETWKVSPEHQQELAARRAEGAAKAEKTAARLREQAGRNKVTAKPPAKRRSPSWP